MEALAARNADHPAPGNIATEASDSLHTGMGSERAQLFRVLAEVGDYAMTLLRTPASFSVELRGDLRFQSGETCEDGPPPGFHSGPRQAERDRQFCIRWSFQCRPEHVLMRSPHPQHGFPAL